ncbi:RloB family protein [Thiomicrorhabdus indica]|uniref:RloB family protein n=1 Tax=Thiomicrorhabdus indica TaxID=2267253 RepID=UPI002AA960E2|nr:RloB family protein [Thiomicrorhabdus indica]
MPRVKRDFNRISGVRDPSLIVIAFEGEVTELRYFEGVKDKLDEIESKLKIEPLPARKNLSSPKHVLEQMNAYRKKYGIGKDDELCLVIDRDKQSWEESEIALVAQECAQKEYLLALSNPCFELWLLLHHQDVATQSEELKQRILENRSQFIKSHLSTVMGGFNTANMNIDRFWAQTELAIERARILDVDPSDRWPNGLATRVYLIMEKVFKNWTPKLAE